MIVVVLLFAGLFFKDFIPLYKQKNIRAMVVFLILFLLALTYAILFVLEVKVEAITVMLWKFMKKIGIAFPSIK